VVGSKPAATPEEVGDRSGFIRVRPVRFRHGRSIPPGDLEARRMRSCRNRSCRYRVDDLLHPPRTSYRSSLNLFAVIAGFLLLRGSLRTAANVRWFCVFVLSACIAAVLAWPAIQPMDLTLTQIRLHPGNFVGGLAFIAFVLAVFYWVITELGHESVQVASDSAGLKRRDMRYPVAFGVGLVIVAGIGEHIILGGESAQRAISLAGKQVGSGYRLHISSLRVSASGDTERGSGIVTAWNDNEIRDIPVEGKKPRY
jgi:hypothetical protein